MSRIVIGIDGSGGGDRALEWGLAEATIRGTSPRVVYAIDWERFKEGLLVAPSREDVEREAQGILDEALKRVTRPKGISVETVVHHSTDRRGAAGALIDATESDDDLLVIGSRGLSGFAGAVLGSVSHRILHHTCCPVVVGP